MSDKYSDDEFESSAATSHHSSSKATSATSSGATSRSSSASAPQVREASGADMAREVAAPAPDASHPDSAADYAAAYTESSDASSSSSASSASTPRSSRPPSIILHQRASPAQSTQCSSHPGSHHHSNDAAVRAIPALSANPAAAPEDRTDRRVASDGGSRREAHSARSKRSHGSPRSARGAEEIRPSPVPETQEQLDDMLVDNEDLRERLLELQRGRYRAGLSSTRHPQQSKKEEAAAAVQETLANERLAQILRAERKDLRQKRDYLKELVKRYKKASKYSNLIDQAKDDIDVLTEENRDLQLEMRCNEKLLLANEEANESGIAAHRLQEELRARNALTERGVQHALRDADDAQRQRDGAQQRVDRLRDELEARRNAPSNRNLDQLDAAREENREKRARIRALEARLSRARGEANTNARAATRNSLRLRAEAEREYLRERIAAMREEIERMHNGGGDDGDVGGLHNNPDGPFSEVRTPNYASASGARDIGYTTELHEHEKNLSGSAGASRKASTAASPQSRSGAAWLEDENSPPKDYRASQAATHPMSGSYTASNPPSAAAMGAADGGEEDPFFGVALGGDSQAVHAPPAAQPTYELSTPAADAPEDDWLLDALRDPTSDAERASRAAVAPTKRASTHDETPDWLMGGENAPDVNEATSAQPAVTPAVLQEEPVDDIFGDLSRAPAAAASAPTASAGGDDVPDWLQF